MQQSRLPQEDKELLSVLRQAALDAAMAPSALILESWGKTLKVDSVLAHDVKLHLDRASEELVLASIRRRFPGHAIYSEELGYLPGVDPFLWIVDPLDGTVNFFHGIPFFCTSVACHRIGEATGTHLENLLPDGRAIGEALVGVVYNPLSEELFEGILSEGAFLNGSPLRITPIKDISQAIILLSLGPRQESIPYMNRLFPRMAERAQLIRNLGSTALDISFVAAGRVGAFIQIGSNLWDFGAAVHILREAGGVVEVEQYAPGRWKVMACNPGIFAVVKELAEGGA